MRANIKLIKEEESERERMFLVAKGGEASLWLQWRQTDKFSLRNEVGEQ